MEDGVVTISRAVGSVRFPAKFMLIAAANPCPCGNFRSDTKQCTCLPGMVARYQKRISGPIIDRIDLHVQVPAVSMEKLTGRTKTGQTSLEIKERVQSARNLQIRRFRDVRITANSEMTTKMVKECCILPDEAQSFLSMAARKFALSARSYYRVIKISRTIADLAGERGISAMHIAEALQYRPQEQ